MKDFWRIEPNESFPEQQEDVWRIISGKDEQHWKKYNTTARVPPLAMVYSKKLALEIVCEHNKEEIENMSDKKEKSWIFCEHANESPSICPCSADCICRDKGNMCEHNLLKQDMISFKDTGDQQPVVAMYMVSDDVLDGNSNDYTVTTDSAYYYPSTPEEPLVPMQKVTITFKDGEERQGFFICDVSNTKCFVVSELSQNPPGWYIEKNRVKAFVK